MLRVTVFLALLFVVPASLIAQASPAAAPVDSQIAPFINNSTLLVAKIDPSRIDPVAAVRWWAKLSGMPIAAEGDNNPANFSTADFQALAAKTWLEDYLSAGGSTAYAVGYMADLQTPAGLILVPLQPDSKVPTLQSLLVNGATGGESERKLDEQNSLEAVVMHDVLVFGITRQVEAMRMQEPAERPIFGEAITSIGDHSLAFAFVPTAALKILAPAALPTELPAELGGGYSSALIQGLSYLAVGAFPPPGESMTAIIHCTTAQAAQAYLKAATRGLDFLKQNASVRADAPDITAMTDALKPRLNGESVALQLEAQAIESAVVPGASELIKASRKRAEKAVLTAQMHQLCIATVNYEMEHQSRFPDDVDALAKYAGGSASLRNLLTDPTHPDTFPGVVYVKPRGLPSTPEATQRTVLFFEAGAPDLMQRAVGFLDGHVEMVESAKIDATLGLQGHSTPRPAAQ